MKQAIQDTAQELAKNGKIEAVTATLTTAAGAVTFLGVVPAILGIVATTSGIALTWVMICKSRMEIKRIKLAIENDGNGRP